MSIYEFVPEYFCRFTICDDFRWIQPVDLVKLSFIDLAGGDIVVVPAGIAVPRKILSPSLDGSVSASKSYLIGDNAKEIILVFIHIDS